MSPAEVPEAAAIALAKALNRYETSGLCPLRGACDLCDCGADMQTPEQQAEDYRRALDRARYTLAAVLPEYGATVLDAAAVDLTSIAHLAETEACGDPLVMAAVESTRGDARLLRSIAARLRGADTTEGTS